MGGSRGTLTPGSGPPTDWTRPEASVGTFLPSLGGLGDVILPSPSTPPPPHAVDVTACVEQAGPLGATGWTDVCAAPPSLVLVRPRVTRPERPPPQPSTPGGTCPPPRPWPLVSRRGLSCDGHANEDAQRACLPQPSQPQGPSCHHPVLSDPWGLRAPQHRGCGRGQPSGASRPACRGLCVLLGLLGTRWPQTQRDGRSGQGEGCVCSLSLLLPGDTSH